MKTSKLLFGLAFVGMTAAACSVKTKTTGSSGAGGDDGGSASTATSTSTVTGPTTSTAGVTTSTSSGGSGCDDGTMGDSGSPECSACLQCAAQSTCASETASCGQGSACADFDDCRVACFDTADANKNDKIDDGAETDAFYTCFGLDPMSGMPDATATMSCVAKNGQGYSDWELWFNCIFGDCPNNCGVGGSNTPICDSGLAVPDPACGKCLTDKCCDVITACANNMDCLKCITKGDMTACGKTMLDEPADDCFANKCGAECQ
ncbi:MAG: hypothetical protein FJ096_20475 [Deltaproteobacteria bacterium]|nr:hypothetical protein [Deltaproteobacteria bacterium]